MTPTTEQVEAWAREAGDAETDGRGRVTFSFDSYGLAKFAGLACDWQREQARQSIILQSQETYGVLIQEHAEAAAWLVEAIRSDCAGPWKAG